MTPDTAIELTRQAVMMAFMLSLPVLAAAMLMGLLISVGQAVTQLQDQTLSFVPKLVAMVFVLLYTLPWTLHLLMEYAADVFQAIPTHL
ncbi:MAG TPA: flagellar biosynthetic protein FliQ [Planctomycetaceae bacterium]|jgi:flagellar biosynthetic protein FliQ|nr:flagellar biosynthetic protein FliQ [Planctomycetaceae bacterium]